MDSTLINSTLKNKDIILDIIKKNPKSQCNIKWNPLPEKVDYDIEVSAEDGGDMISEFDTFTLYVVKSWAKTFNNNLKPIENALIGLLLPPKYTMLRVSLYREIIEAKSSLNAIPKNGIAFFDGSLTPLIAWWRPSASIKNGEELDILLEEADNELKNGGYFINKIDDLLNESLYHPLIPLMLMDKEQKDQLKPMIDAFLAMEILEKLYLYKILLEKIFENNSLPIFISKTSRSTRLCNSNLPDVHIIKKMVRSEPGYVYWDGSLNMGASNIIGEKNMKKMFPKLGGIEDFYENRLGMVRFYARFQHGAPILQVEALFDQNKGIPDTEDFINQVISKIILIPLQQGYPTSLVFAHKNAEITHDDMEALIKVAGIEGELKERSMLLY
ncbi:NurA domain-containing protein [Caldisphaera lagunensis DSM 15908]|uniref:NurA domain-containing protein n=1 Tax=Caldisphaera lagunensis (strain DSM 15908 / JCM 11604 / ANMR 0165 / IC-154) TaxID=1056495 RepID=L0A8Z7_CALLD|nr:DNA double-strand break repair nuclease NurA [Caldisphaera lagunensis]AFZ70363.1 NurA domain-containing protein [Caldisphaera lagunensis DSM 15908]